MKTYAEYRTERRLCEYEEHLGWIIYYTAYPNDRSGVMIKWHTNEFEKDLKRNLNDFERGVFIGVEKSRSDHIRNVIEMLCTYGMTDQFVELVAWLLNELHKESDSTNNEEMEL